MKAKGGTAARVAGSIVFLLSVCILCSVAQEQPIAVSDAEADLWNHYIRPLKMIHSEKAKDLRFESDVVLKVIVSIGGNVESAHAIQGPKQFFATAEEIERDRQFHPFEQNGISVRALITDYVSIVPPEQWAETKVPFPEVRNLNSLRVTLKRTHCYGPCPSYSVEVQGNGDVIYRGDGNVLITGEHRARISPEAVRNLMQVFRSADYFSLKDGYARQVTDAPTFRTSIEFDGKRKSVGDYVGYQAGMPDVVTELEDKIDEVAGTEKWLRETDQTWPALLAEHWDFRADTDGNRAMVASVCEHGSAELVRHFIAEGAPTLVMSKSGESPLVNIAEKGNLDLVRVMVSNHEKLSSQLLFRALRAAAHSGKVDLMEFLIRKGADVNGNSGAPNDRNTVLMGAASSCKNDAVAEILRYHPDVNAQDVIGDSVLSRLLENCASTDDMPAILESLISAGADVNLKGNRGQTPIFPACYSGSRAVGILARAGANLNHKDDLGETALMSCFTPDFLKAMIANGADLYTRDHEGHTAAEAAHKMGATDKAELLDAAMKAAKQ